MNPFIPLVFALILPFGPSDASAAESDVPLEAVSAVEINLNDFLWLSRPIVVFADSEADPRFRDQIKLLQERAGELTDRDVVLITDTDPSAMSELRTKLRPRGFMLVLIGKDGGVKLRKPFPWNVREITSVIDKSPLRQQELRTKRGIGNLAR